MEILVCIKQVPGTTEVNIDEETGSLIRDGIDTKMNPYDLYALESALRLKELVNCQVSVLTMGPPQAKEILAEAFMMGADAAYLLTDRAFAGADCLATAYALSQCIERIGLPDLIICGRQTTDGDTAQVGPELAEFLDIPHMTNVNRINSINAERILVEADLPVEVQVVEMVFPGLITVEKDIFQPRLPSYRLKKKTAEREITTFSLRDLADPDSAHYGLSGSPTQVVRIFPPESTHDREIITGEATVLAEKIFDVLSHWKFV